jgi:H+/gluconate symporter-like permease
MVITIPLVLLLAVVVALLLRFKAVGFGAAVAVALFGFYLAGTGANDTVNQLVTAVTGALADIGR